MSHVPRAGSFNVPRNLDILPKTSLSLKLVVARLLQNPHGAKQFAIVDIFAYRLQYSAGIFLSKYMKLYVG